MISPLHIAYVFISAALVALSLNALRRWRRELLAGFSLAFVVLSLKSLRSIGVLAGFLVLHFVAVQLMVRTRAEVQRRRLFWGWLVVALASFVVVKQYWWLTDPFISRTRLPSGIATVGLSFIFFRQLALASDASDGEVKSVNALDYLNFNLAFWSFLAGPLQRYGEFNQQSASFSSARPSSVEALAGLNRMVLGALKIVIVAAAANKFATPSTYLLHPDGWHLLLFLLAFPVYLYVNFSGYCDVVIGFSAAVGFVLPENFNHPYLARNINDFWSRWHISLSELLRDYLLFPLQTSLTRRLPLLWAMSIATVCSFIVMGAWHGNSLAFVVFGLLHAAGVVAANLYTELLRRFLGKEGLKRYRRSRLVHVLAVVLCQIYVVLTFLPFKYSTAELVSVLHRMRGL